MISKSAASASHSSARRCAVASTPGVTVVKTRRDRWVEVDVPASESDAFVSWVLSFGADARLTSPKVLRDQVVARLQAVASGE